MHQKGKFQNAERKDICIQWYNGIHENPAAKTLGFIHCVKGVYIGLYSCGWVFNNIYIYAGVYSKSVLSDFLRVNKDL